MRPALCGNDTAMIPVTKVHELTIGSSRNDDHPPHVSAASSLVRHKGQIFVVADDEYSLLIFSEADLGPGHFMPILEEGDLPEDREARKKEKADLESLALLPPFAHREHGALLALGSGSSDKRNRGVLVALDENGRPTEEHVALDLRPLYEELATDIKGLNIEGAEVVGDTLWLMQRGNENGDNALVNLSLEAATAALTDDRILPPGALRTIDHVDLGQLQGERLCFSDASALPDGRIVFAASTEASDDAVSDGQSYGSALGIIETDGLMSFVEPVDLIIKIEGIDARPEGDGVQVLMVTDADDPDTPSPLLEARIPR